MSGQLGLVPSVMKLPKNICEGHLKNPAFGADIEARMAVKNAFAVYNTLHGCAAYIAACICYVPETRYIRIMYKAMTEEVWGHTTLSKITF